MAIPFHKAYITDEEISEVVDSLKSGWITMGPKTVEFEDAQFSNYSAEVKPNIEILGNLYQRTRKL